MLFRKFLASINLALQVNLLRTETKERRPTIWLNMPFGSALHVQLGYFSSLVSVRAPVARRRDGPESENQARAPTGYFLKQS